MSKRLVGKIYPFKGTNDSTANGTHLIIFRYEEEDEKE